MKILIAEDDVTSALLLQKILQGDGHRVTATSNGNEALEALRHERFDALITDWMMPELDGIGLIRHARAEFETVPPILVVTALTSKDAHQHAMEAGADDYLAKPYEPQQLLRRLRDCVQRAEQPMPGISTRLIEPRDQPTTDFVGVGLAASTGGPEALRKLLGDLEPAWPAAYFIVLHGPGWMLETFVERVSGESRLRAELARDGASVNPGRVTVCPGDVHMQVDPSGDTIRLHTGPPENFVRPAADPLFRSLASAFGPRSMGVVLTGMGRDASLGSQAIADAGGRILVQDPNLSVAASMPRSVVSLGLAREILPLDRLAAKIGDEVQQQMAVAVNS